MIAALEKNSGAARWFPARRPGPAAAVRLFAFPCAGGAASFYRGWSGHFSAEVDFLPVQLPGRETRFREPFPRDLAGLLDDLLAGLRPWLDRPFAFFGHSMGALVSFELARRLRAAGGPEPTRLFVSAFRAPRLPYGRRVIYPLPDAEFLAELAGYGGLSAELLGNQELMALLTPLFKADFRVHESYAYEKGDPLSCPIMAFGGTEDTHVSEREIQAWAEETSGAFRALFVPGGHYFPRDHAKTMAEVMAGELGVSHG